MWPSHALGSALALPGCSCTAARSAASFPGYSSGFSSQQCLGCQELCLAEEQAGRDTSSTCKVQQPQDLIYAQRNTLPGSEVINTTASSLAHLCEAVVEVPKAMWLVRHQRRARVDNHRLNELLRFSRRVRHCTRVSLPTERGKQLRGATGRVIGGKLLSCSSWALCNASQVKHQAPVSGRGRVFAGAAQTARGAAGRAGPAGARGARPEHVVPLAAAHEWKKPHGRRRSC